MGILPEAGSRKSLHKLMAVLANSTAPCSCLVLLSNIFSRREAIFFDFKNLTNKSHLALTLTLFQCRLLTPKQQVDHTTQITIPSHAFEELLLHLRQLENSHILLPCQTQIAYIFCLAYQKLGQTPLRSQH